MNVEDMSWADHQRYEAEWWSTCHNTFAEESKQISYAYRMGLVVVPDPTGNERWPMYDLAGKSVLDIGGGPCSLLLKTFNGESGNGGRVVVDPCDYPEWVEARYHSAGIGWAKRRGEDTGTFPEFDEVWVYNCLQHVEDPAKIVQNARGLGAVVRAFEWVNVGVCAGHPWNLTAELLDEWYGGRGTVERMTGENACYGTAWYGVFPGIAKVPDGDADR
jgi:hypothetical protein